MDIIDYMFNLLLELIGWIFKGIFNLIAWIIGKIFTNKYAAIAAGVVITIIILVNMCSGSDSPKSKAQTEVYQVTTTYVCTARKSLKVRTAPDVNAQQIGSLMSGEEVEVYEIVGDFARIQFNGSEGYASIKYLQQK